MAPTVRKAGNGELRQRKGKSVAEDDSDEELLSGGGGGWLDNFIMLRAVVFMITSAAALFKGSKDASTDEAATTGKGKDDGKKKDKASLLDKEEMKEAAREQLRKNVIPIFLTVVMVLTCLLIICGEGFNEREDREKPAVEDYYGTLGVTRDAESADVKRAYKTLAKRWHPDKNPNCSTCAETFGKIAVAYETLFDDKKRAAYDESGDIASAELKSPRSVPLTHDNFDELVTYSNDVWIVQIFKPDDGNCAQFHPFWENQIQKYGHLVRFGRVDITSDVAKWLPVKYRILPTILKFARHLGSPQIFPITAMHETGNMLMKFVLTSFPNIGLPLHADKSGLQRWVSSATKHHKVLLVIPGKSEEERYKSHLVARKLASRWSELFEFRTAETSVLHKLSAGDLPAEIRAVLPPEGEAGSKAAIIFFAANGDPKPKASAIVPWPASEDAMVLHMLDFAKLSPPALTPRTADLLCRSLAIRRVYCLVLVDPPDNGVKKAMEELEDSRVAYGKEVEEVRDSGSDVSDEEDNFIVPTVRLFRRAKGLQPSISTCRAPKYNLIEQALNRSSAMLLDLDTGRIAALKGITSFRSIYSTVAYEEATWVDEALHPFLSLPDCDEGAIPHFIRTSRSASLPELLMKLLTAVFFLEAVAKAATDRNVKWACGAGMLLMVMLIRSAPFVRSVVAYIPGALFSPTLL